MSKKTFFKELFLLILSFPLIYLSLFPFPYSKEESLFNGIYYRRVRLSDPRPIMLHIATIDLNASGVRALVTPGLPGAETIARRTSDFLQEFKLQLAINGSSFSPFQAEYPWSYKPLRGTQINITGVSISNGVTYSLPVSNWPALCISKNKIATITTGICPKDTEQGLAGIYIIAKQGVPIKTVIGSTTNELQPRTAVGISSDGTKLWLAVADGRQPLYSEGITSSELANILVELGANNVIELDGGGSSTMVTERRYWFWPKVLNSPIHTHIPLRERPLGNHLGFFAERIG